MGVVHSLWISKLRYGLQLCTRVRLTDSDVTTCAMKTLQLTQNRLLRVLNGTKIKDRISIRSMLEKFQLLSVHQLAAKIKLIEVWKTINRPDYPLSLDPYNGNQNTPSHDLRTQQNRIFNDSCKLKKSELSFHKDGARLWNVTTVEVKTASSLNIAKKKIDIYCRSLPI